MADANHSELPTRVAVGVIRTWRQLGFDQRLAAVGALLLIVSTFGPFSFVEGAMLVTSVGVLVLLRARARGRDFHVPFGDGAVIAAAGAWSALLILVRLFNRPLGQGLLALVCAAILIAAGIREHGRRPADDAGERLASDGPPDEDGQAPPPAPASVAPPSTAPAAGSPPGPDAQPAPAGPAVPSKLGDPSVPAAPAAPADPPAPQAATAPDVVADQAASEELPEPASRDETATRQIPERAPSEDETAELEADDAAEAETIELRRASLRDPILAEDETEPIVTRLNDERVEPPSPGQPDLPSAADELSESLGDPPEFVPPARTSRWRPRRHRKR